MPQYELPIGTESLSWYQSRDEVCQGYIEAMFFTEANPDNDELKDASVDDLSTEARERICKDCMAFQATPAYKALWDDANGELTFDREQVGRDFWFTRNGHGVGFWDRDADVYGPHADALTAAAQAFGSVDLYKGDDGKLYL